ncbi:MAG: MBL-fold metallo-hydrolase superfamily [Rhodanobacteraceae bacterium]|jgi:glyoxylase-like metal-dependent hydrolase (beta-lactamase superfamily II)|nr:MAG: MBL-fold metallo-hydrolase superfamily [Rhodanobacteraceae bacterium]
MPRFSVAHPEVESFFHKDTGTWTHVVHDGEAAAIIDPVLDYDAAPARTANASADTLLTFTQRRALRIAWILETHAHADHLSAAGYLHDATGAPIAIGRGIIQVQAHFKQVFGLGDEFVADGRQFDRLLDDGDELPIGSFAIRALATPGHTRDSLTYVAGDAAFIGDTLFAPDIGTARCDFPGGDALQLYASIRRILALPESTRLFLCHDYPPPTRTPWRETTIACESKENVHVGGGVAEEAFVAKRRARDATLPVPRLLLPALQVNIRGGRLPPADAEGQRYLRLPLNRIG